MSLVKRLVVGGALAAVVMLPAVPASAGPIPQAPFQVAATWHDSGPYVDGPECVFNRQRSEQLGYPTLACEQNPTTGRWYFLIWW
jgi:hypothetical protein